MRRSYVFSLTFLLTAAGPAATQNVKTFPFSKEDVGKVPQGWKATQTNEGKGSVWKVVLDATAPSKTGVALAQTAESPSKVFNLCIKEGMQLKDLEVSVSFKAVKGDVDQGGGLVWRYQDPQNYYVARMNPLETNFRLYKVVDGKRIQLASADKLKVPIGAWHSIKIRHVGDHIMCFLDDQKVVDERDNTVAAAGLVGLWTKADAQTYFDGLRFVFPQRETH
jgi:hypothetical protein